MKTKNGFMNGVQTRKKQHMNNINAICQHFSHKNTFWLPVENAMQQHLRFHWFASIKQAICNRVDQIEIVFKTYSHCIRFAFWKTPDVISDVYFFFLSLSISHFIYTNLATKIICASYELDEALIEKGICMLNSLFIHILHPKIKFKLQTNMKKKYVYKTEFHMHNRSNFLLFHNKKFIHRRIFRAMVSISLSYFDGTKSVFPF